MRALGLAFGAVKADGLAAAAGTTDFAGLFVGFSFFLIGSAAILIALLFRLGLERRAGEVGLERALGVPPATVRRLHLAEGLAVVTLGGLLGTAGAVAYAAGLLWALRTVWVGAVGTRELELAVGPLSLGGRVPRQRGVGGGGGLVGVAAAAGVDGAGPAGRGDRRRRGPLRPPGGARRGGHGAGRGGRGRGGGGGAGAEE